MAEHEEVTGWEACDKCNQPDNNLNTYNGSHLCEYCYGNAVYMGL